MADVFIPYAREDMSFVRDLYRALTSQGKDAWVAVTEPRWRALWAGSGLLNFPSR